ncbi:MAG: glutathione S-transferase family protein [Alcanivoracaceae bacterium]|nr:glutathione S-transferase family protein [Alcanivoracaceae bacterium]
MIDLYTTSSPNGYKVTILLEELKLPYRLHHIKISNGDNKTAAFLKMSPHGRIPIIKDQATRIVVFESAAILLYLAEKSGNLISTNPKSRWQTLQWLMFNSATLAPLLGQRVNYEIFEAKKIIPAINRYQKLTIDAFFTMNKHLSTNHYFAGAEYSIADIAAFGWMHICEVCNFKFDGFPHLWRWYQEISNREAVKKGVSLPHRAIGP